MLYFKSFKNAFPAYDLVQIEDVLDKDPDLIIIIYPLRQGRLWK